MRKPTCRSTLILALAVLIGLPVHAATSRPAPAGPRAPVKSAHHASARPPALQEIIVTAQYRRQSLLDVPMSIVAITGKELRQRGITSIDDLNFAVPGLAIDPEPNGYRRIEIRGVSNIFGVGALIGLYLDQADVTDPGGTQQRPLQTYDLARVEVLRGPQGTLYGQGSMGGTIRFITNKPVLDRFQMNTDTQELYTQDGDPGQRIEAMLNTPVVTNQLGLRFAGVFEHNAGWVDFPAARLKNINQNNLMDVRIEGLWKPAHNFTASTLADIHRTYGGGNTWENGNGDYTANFNLAYPPKTANDFGIYNVTLTWNAAPVRLLSTTTYTDHNTQIWNNDAGILQFFAPPAPAFEDYEPYYHDFTDTLVQDIRLSSLESGPWRWTLGGSYDHVVSASRPFSDYFGLPIAPGTALPPPVSYYGWSWFNEHAFYGNTSYTLGRLTLGAGARDYQERIHSYGYNGYCYPVCFTSQHGRFHSVDPRFYARYKLSPDANLYASAAKGFRGGGFNGLGQPPFAPESVWTYELGTKNALPSQRLRFDVDIFYSNYSNYVVVGEIPGYPSNIYSNAGDARIDGTEWGVAWEPAHWSIDLSGYYLHEYNFVRINTLNQSQYDVGDDLDGVPRYTYNASVQREFLWTGKPGFVRLDYSLRARTTYRARQIGPWYFSESDVIHMLNLNTGLHWNGHLQFGFFVDNLLNDRDYIGQDRIEHFAVRARPRTYGFKVGVTFD